MSSRTERGLPATRAPIGQSSADEARRRLHAEQLTRMRDPNYSDWKVQAIRQHFAEGPIDGVYELDNVVADRVVDDGSRLRLTRRWPRSSAAGISG